MNYLIKDKKMEFASVPVIDTWRAMEKLGIQNNILLDILNSQKRGKLQEVSLAS